MAQNDPLVTLGPWPKGMNNVKPSRELNKDELRDAYNVDVHDSGIVRSRYGYTELRSGNAFGGAFYHAVRDALIWTEAGSLYSAPLTNFTQAVVLANGFSSEPIYYVSVNDEAYYSNGSAYGIIGVAGTRRRWGVPAPEGYVVTASSGGGFAAGKYLVAATFVTETGEESSASEVTEIELATNGAVSITGVPNPSGDPDITTVRFYVSEPNGAELYATADVAVGIGTVLIAESPFRGKPLPDGSLRLERFPALTHLEYYNGRIFGALGPMVFHTEPLRYGVYRPLQNFLMHGADVSLIAATLDGVYIAADKTYFYPNAGNPNVASVTVFDYGAAAGTVIRNVDGVRGNLAWWSERGLVIAGPGGQAKVLTGDVLAVPKHKFGAAMYRHKDGVKQIVATVGGGGDHSRLVATDWVDAEFIRGDTGNEG